MEHSEGEHGRTGPGIMDYGDGKLNGIYQFNTRYRKQEMCRQMNSVAWLTRISTPIWRFPIHVPQIHPNFNPIFHQKKPSSWGNPMTHGTAHDSSGYCHFKSRHDRHFTTFRLRDTQDVNRCSGKCLDKKIWCPVLDLGFGPLGFVVHHIWSNIDM